MRVAIPSMEEDTLQTRLREARVGRLATADRKGHPHVVPICFCYDGRAFYTPLDLKPKRVSADRLRRLRNILANPRIALLVDRYQDDWKELWFILVFGEAALLSEAEERGNACRLLREKYPQYASGLLSERSPLIRITPTRITSWEGR